MKPKPATYQDGFEHGRLLGNIESAITLLIETWPDQLEAIETLRQMREEVLDVIGGEIEGDRLTISNSHASFTLPATPRAGVKINVSKED